jgi:hypothetical protein
MKTKVKHYEIIMAVGIIINIVIFSSLSKRLDKYITTVTVADTSTAGQ